MAVWCFENWFEFLNWSGHGIFVGAFLRLVQIVECAHIQAVLLFYRLNIQQMSLLVFTEKSSSGIQLLLLMSSKESS